MKHLLLLSFSLILIVSPALSLTSKDAYVIRKGDAWTLGTAKVERTLRLADGKFVTRTWRDKASGRELLPAGTVSDELGAVIDGQTVRGGPRAAGSSWTPKSGRSPQGEIQLDLTLRRDSLEVTKSYVVYPGSSIIREWVSFKNAGTGPLRVSEPGFLNLTTKPGPPESVDFHWMTGGVNEPGSWTLKTEKLKAGKIREFDSYDPFGGTAEGNFLGDGVLAKVLVNDRQVWPLLDGHDENWAAVSYGWTAVANSTVRMPLRTSVDVVAGDKVRFILNRNDSAAKDTTAFDPTITYADHEAHTASKEFSKEQGKNGWQYQYADQGEFYDSKVGQFLDLAYSDASQRWTKPGEKEEDSLFIGAGEMHPGKTEDVALVWVAPQAGRVKITADLTNVGNPPVPGARRHAFIWAPAAMLLGTRCMSRDTGEGVFMGWDYFGHWASDFTLTENGAVNARFRVAGYDKTLQPGESLTTPLAFVGLFQKDLDEAGNECLDWQYAYLWDYTRPGWFPAIRMLGWWWKGTPWKDPSNTWVWRKWRRRFRFPQSLSRCGPHA